MAKLKLILDNAKNLQEVSKLLVKDVNIPIIITTRNQKTIPIGVQTINLDQMTLEDSLNLLRNFVSSNTVDENIQVAQEICHLCGYLPLALAIAGSQMQDKSKWSTIEIYCNKLRARKMDLLSKGDDYSNNISITFDLSYEDLDEAHKSAFDAIALFNGPDFSQEAISAIFNLTSEITERVLDKLVELSLVIRIGERFRVHDLIRDYSNEKIKNRTDSELILWKKRLTSYYAKFTQDNTSSYSRIDIERLNILGIVDHKPVDSDWVMSFINIARYTTEYLKVRGLWNEAYRLGEEAFNLASKNSFVEAQAELATRNLSWVSYFHGDFEKSKYWAKTGFDLFDHLGKELDSAYAARRYAMVLIDLNDYKEAQLLLEKSLKTFRKFGQQNKIGDTLTILGYLQRKQGHFDSAENLLLDALAIVEEINDQKEISMTLYNLARLRAIQSKKKEAVEMHLQSLVIDENLNRKPGIAWNLLRLSQLEIELENSPEIQRQRLLKSSLLFGEMGVKKYDELISTLLCNLKDKS